MWHHVVHNKVETKSKNFLSKIVTHFPGNSLEGSCSLQGLFPKAGPVEEILTILGSLRLKSRLEVTWKPSWLQLMIIDEDQLVQRVRTQIIWWLSQSFIVNVMLSDWTLPWAIWSGRYLLWFFLTSTVSICIFIWDINMYVYIDISVILFGIADPWLFMFWSCCLQSCRLRQDERM